MVPANYTFTPADQGVHVFINGVTLITTTIETVTASDTVSGSITGSLTVNVTNATHFLITAPSTATAGTAFTVTVTALNASGSLGTPYTGTVHFAMSDSAAAASFPADYTFVSGDGGVKTFTTNVKLVTVGTQSVTVTDTGNSGITGTVAVTVNANSATSLQVTAPALASANGAFTVTVTALDTYGNTATGYAGSVQFASSDGSATLHSNYTFVSGDHGVHVFTGGTTLVTLGSQTVTATDMVITGSTTITVDPDTPAYFKVTAPAAAYPGAASTVTVTAIDAFGDVATSYTGTVHFATGDVGTDAVQTILFSGLFTGSTFNLIFGTDTTSAITYSTVVATTLSNIQNALNSLANIGSGNTAVTAISVDGFNVRFQGSLADEPQALMTAVQSNMSVGNWQAGASVVLPINYTFVSGDHGVRVFTSGVTLQTVGDQVVTVNDTTTASIAGSAALTVAEPVISFSAVQYTVNQTKSGTPAAWSGTVTITLNYTGPAIVYGDYPLTAVDASPLGGTAQFGTDWSFVGTANDYVGASFTTTTVVLYITVADQHVPAGGQDYFTLNLAPSGTAINPNLATTEVFISDNSGVNSASAAVLSTDPATALTVPVAEADVDVTTGAVRLSQPLDFDQSPGTDVGGDPALVYNSATVDARPIVQALVQTNAASGLATDFKLALTWGTIAQSTVTFTPNGTDPAGLTYALAQQVNTPISSTGFYNWSLAVTIDYSASSVTLTPLSGTTFVDDAASSPFGAGWGIQSVDQLYDNTSTVAIVTGAGDYRLFTASGTVSGVTSYTNPPEDFGTFVKTVVGGTTTYAYTAQDGTQWNFNGAGLQTSVVDPHGLTTTYSYNGGNELTEVQAPTAA